MERERGAGGEQRGQAGLKRNVCNVCNGSELAG